MDFDIKCSSIEQANAAILKIKSIILELGLAPYNAHTGSGLGGNPKQLLVMHAMEHVLTDKQQGVFINKNVCYWNVASVHSSTRKELRKYIDIAFEQKVPNSNIGPALLLNHLLSEGTESKFLDRYVSDSTDLPEVQLILSGKQFDFRKLTSMDLLLVSTVAAGLMARMMDALPDWLGGKKDMIVIPEVDNLGMFFSKLPAETALIVLRSMVGLNRIVMKGLDENKHWDALLKNINETLV